MTYLEKYMQEHPGEPDHTYIACPEDIPGTRDEPCPMPNILCDECWNREIPEKKLGDIMNETGYVMNTDNPNVKEKPIHRPEYDEPMPCKTDPNVLHKSGSEPFGIKDSGARREFETGAVRDIQEGKGRCDLLPLDVVGELVAIVNAQVLYEIDKFKCTGDKLHLEYALARFVEKIEDIEPTESPCLFDRHMSNIFLEVSKHFEEGAKKYGEYNWQKGIPTHCYIDSAVRHYLKYLRGDNDEPHDRAFVWNILCCIWTCIHKPELNDYRKDN